MPDTTTNTTTPTPAPVTRRTPADQDQEMANEITTAEQAVNAALKSEEILALLEPRSYEAKELNKGLALQATAQGAFAARQTATGTEEQAKQLRDTAENTARAQFSDYRQTCQANYTQAADRAALGASGRVPTDLQKFITNARAAYTAASKAPYADTLEVYGYDAKKLKEAQVGLDLLSDAEGEYSARAGDSTVATKTRDVAHAALMTWFNKFRRITKLALKGQPGLLEKLSL